LVSRLAFLLVAALLACDARGQAHTTDVYVFWQRGCPYCEREIDYLTRLEMRDPAVRAHYFELRGTANARLYRAIVEELELRRVGTPLTVIGGTAILGYLDDASTGREIDALVAACARAACVDRLAALAAELGATEDRARALVEIDTSTSRPTAEAGSLESIEPERRVRLPWLGEVDLRSLSLPLLTVTLAAIDGFNPCAMWVLVFLIGLLLGLQDAARRWVLGGAFLLTTAVVYYAVIAAWLNALLVFGAVAWLRAAVGVVALAGGMYYAYEYFRNPEALCRVASDAQRQRVMTRLRAAAAEPKFFAAIAAVVALAVGVNFIEFLCSAGIPAVYTQVLALTPMPTWEHHAWLALYVLVFLADDVAVFTAAMLTLELTGTSARYAHHVQLLGGAVLLVLGVLLIARPEWLTFG
jgi:glutaredoxin